jgi:hypothetical protein
MINNKYKRNKDKNNYNIRNNNFYIISLVNNKHKLIKDIWNILQFKYKTLKIILKLY